MLYPTWSSLILLGGFASTYAARREFNLDLTWEKGAPNGFERELIHVNGQFPGPPLKVDEGDEVKVNVLNNLPFNTSIHFHGIEQKNTPWSDGVAGLSQWAIQPGETYTYRWVANTYGTYWYHAHDKSKIMDGLYGALRVRPASGRINPFSLISTDKGEINALIEAEKNGELIVLSDWDHLTSEEYMMALEASGYDIFCSDSILVNGHGSVYCKDPDELTNLMPKEVQNAINATLTDRGCIPFVQPIQGYWEHHPEKVPDGLKSGCQPSHEPETIFHVDPCAGWANLNFISAASLKVLVVSIDEHPMYVYEVDGHYIEPQLVESLTMYNGERYSVMIKLDKKPANYKMRIANDGKNQVISGFANLLYAGGENSSYESKPYIDYGGQNTTAQVVKLDPDNLPPYPAVVPSLKADDFHLLTLGRINSSWQWTLDGTAFLPANLATMEPILENPQNPALESALKITTKNNTWVDIVFQLQEVKSGVIQPPHPIHKHSNKAFLIGRGKGTFEWESVDAAIKASPGNFFEKPVYRDTFVTAAQGGAWMAIRYHVVNPGAFLLHCHMETHLANGMGMVILDGIDAWTVGM